MEYTLPDGTKYEVSDEDWKLAKKLWAQKDTWPVGVKFSRSFINDEKKHVVKIIYPDSQGVKKEELVESESPLTCSFTYSPISKADVTPILWAIQHEEDKEDKRTRYFSWKRDKDPEKEVTGCVKWQFPDPDFVTSHNLEPTVYKSERALDYEPADIELEYAVITRYSKRISSMPYLGPNLLTIIQDSNTSLAPDEVMSIVQQMCTLVKEQHDKDILLIDINLENFAYKNKVVALLDGSAPGKKEDIRKRRTIVTRYLPPECDSNETISEKTDVYALGRTLEELCSNVHDEQKKKYPFCFIQSQATSMQKGLLPLEKIISLLSSISSASPLHKEAIVWFLETFPEQARNISNIENLLKSPVLLCTVLGVKAYLASIKKNQSTWTWLRPHIHRHGVNGECAAKELIQALLPQDEKVTINESEIVQKINEKIKDSSPKVPHSRASLFNERVNLQNPERNLCSFSDEEQKIVLRWNNIFHQFPDIVQRTRIKNIAENPLLHNILLKSLDYLEAETTGLLARRSVENLVRTLLSKTRNENSITQKVTTMCSPFLYFGCGFPSLKIGEKKNKISRQDILNELPSASKTAPST